MRIIALNRIRCHIRFIAPCTPLLNIFDMTILIQELVYVIPEGFSKFHSFRILKMSRTLASIQLTSTLFLTNLRSGCWLITMNILMIRLDHDYTAIIHMFSVCTSKCRVSIIREAVRKKKSTPFPNFIMLIG